MRIPTIHDPFRPTNWRWERARWLREHGKYARKGADDDLTIAAKAFQAAESRSSSELGRQRLALRFPGIFHAKEIYDREERDVRWTIEARLLAGEKLTRIAERSQTSHEVVWWYEKLFFNVLPCLKAPDYICNVVVGSSLHHGLNDREYDLLWKLYGYFGGSYVLDFIITTFSDQPKPADPSGAPAYLTDDGRMTVKRKSAIAARILPMHNNFTLQIIMETHSKLLEIEKNAGDNDVQDIMKDHIGSMFGTLGAKLLYAGNKPNYVDTPKLAHYDGQAAELRASEHIAVTLGKDSQEIMDGVNWKFPEAPVETPIAERVH